jgi:lysophospholipase L1-like esterase
MSLTLKLVLTPVLVAQAVATRARLPRLPEAEGPREGTVGAAATTGRQRLRLLVAGDSSAAGVGVAHQSQALAPQLGERVAERCAAQVQWWLHAKSGVTSAQTLQLLHGLHQAAALAQADIAVVVTGVNDLIDHVPSQRAVAHREALANWLRNAQGVHHVVFAPLPPVHHFPGLPQPLRWVAGSDARRHNDALRDWAATRSDVSVPDMDAPLNPGTMASDGFHPGEPVYRYCASAIAEHIATAVWPTLPKETHT